MCFSVVIVREEKQRQQTGPISQVSHNYSGVSSVTKVYTYSGNTLYLAESSGGNLQSTDTVTLNSDGLMTSDTHFQVQGGGFNTVSTYTYSGVEIQSAVTKDLQGNTLGTETYSWSGGNMVGISGMFGGLTYSLTYTYNNEQTQNGDYWQLEQLVASAAPTIRNTRMGW